LSTIVGENGLPITAMLHGHPDLANENLLQLDAGYRLQVGSTASVDVSAFRGAYDHSATLETEVPQFDFLPYPHVVAGVHYDSLLKLRTTGAEVSGHWSPAWRWRFDGSYSALHVTPKLDPRSTDPAAAQFDGDAPAHQWQLHATSVITRRLQASAAVFRTGRLRQLMVPGYTRADARIEFKMTSQLTAAVAGQNLTTPSHLEFSDFNTGLVGSRVPRTARVQLRWQF
jgi:outer membrane receptor protein involved in Fe transport